MEKRFTYTSTQRFNNCSDCPFRGTDYSDDCEDQEYCERTGKTIRVYTCDGNRDYSNADGVMDDCPFIENNTITEEK